MSVKIGFYGAAGEVTGSNFLLETSSGKYVVDCGLFQGSDTMTSQNDKHLPYQASEIDAVILTHAHLDHVGRLPKLVREGFHGPIYTTDATAELASLVLEDAWGLMLDRQGRGGHHPLMYEEQDLRRTLASFKPIRYQEPVDLGGGDRVTLFDAGHILGSATAFFEANGKKIVFSGDIGTWPSLLLPPPEEIREADIVVTEATYGGQERDNHPNRLKILQDALDWTAQNRGVLLIPAFAIERTQEILYLLNHLSNDSKLPSMPIFLDSPLAIEALEVFEKHQNLFASSVQRYRKMDHEIFSFKRLALTAAVEDSKDINNQPPPKVIIAGSGMMEGGRIYHHLKHYISSEKTYLLVVGHQVEGTLGRQIIDGAQAIRIMNQELPVRAKVVAVDVFSSHADNDQLVEWLSEIAPHEGHQLVFVAHSNPDHAKAYIQSASHLKEREFRLAEIDKVVTIP